MEKQNEANEEEEKADAKADDSAFSVNDWDIEKGIFNLVISLVQQRTHRMDKEIARESVINFLESMITGLKNPEDSVGDKIDKFIKQQRTEDIND